MVKQYDWRFEYLRRFNRMMEKAWAEQIRRYFNLPDNVIIKFRMKNGNKVDEGRE